MQTSTTHKILKNGLHIVLHDIENTRKCCAAIFVKAGADFETKKTQGISHFLEHMAFKGTKTRTKKEIVETIEYLGADINAYTSRDRTAYFAQGRAVDWKCFVDILSDIVLNSTFPEDEIEKEMDVILQEYWSNRSENSVFAQETAQAMQFKNQAYGRPILGTERSIKAVTQTTLQTYVQQFYVPNNMVIGLSGNLGDIEEKIKYIESIFESIPKGPELPAMLPVPEYHAGTKICKRTNPQAYVCINFKGLPDCNPHLNLVSAIAVGNGFSSPLFNEVRENQGLAYHVVGLSERFINRTVISIEAEVFPQNVPNLLRSVKVILNDSITNLSQKNLERALNCLRSDIDFIFEENLKYLEIQADSLFEKNELIDFDEDLALLEAITLDDIKKTIAYWVSQPPVIVVVGSCKKDMPLNW